VSAGAQGRRAVKGIRSGRSDGRTPAPKAPVLADGHYDAYIQQVNTRGDYLVVDLVQVFQGQAAIDAAMSNSRPAYYFTLTVAGGATRPRHDRGLVTMLSSTSSAATLSDVKTPRRRTTGYCQAARNRATISRSSAVVWASSSAVCWVVAASSVV
jgi:hypothetical protein